MDSTHDIRDHPLAQAWEMLQAQHTQGEALQVDSNRLAFADPEFLLRRETRGIRFQLEMLKPDLASKSVASNTPWWCLAVRVSAPNKTPRNICAWPRPAVRPAPSHAPKPC